MPWPTEASTSLSKQTFRPGIQFRQKEPELATWLEENDRFEVEPGGKDAGRALRRGWKKASEAPLLSVEEIEAALGIDLSSAPPEGS